MKKKRIVNIVFKLVIIVILVITLFLNNNYNDIKDRKLINSKETYEEYKNNKYVTFDLSNAEESRLVLEDNKDYKIYTINYDDIDILFVLNEGTTPTDKVNLMYNKDYIGTLDLKATFNDENTNNFINGYYTNKNLKVNENVCVYTVYATFIFMLILLITIFKDIILLFKKENTTL